MTQHDDDLRLRHMLDHGREALGLVRNIDKAAFQQDRLLQLGIVRLLEIVGEAASRTEVATRDQYPSIPWRRIIGLRNRLVHAYDMIDLGIVWSIVARDLPRLVEEFEKILGLPDDS